MMHETEIRELTEEEWLELGRMVEADEVDVVLFSGSLSREEVEELFCLRPKRDKG
jgi:hypothetical protein